MSNELLNVEDYLIKKDIFKSIKLSVIMPVYNEKNTIRKILELVEAVHIPKEIVIVDDYSIDGTREILREIEKEKQEKDNNIKIFYHDKNMGKGAAIRTAIKEATGDIIIIQDADLEYDPQDYYRVIYPIVIGKADVVYGSRFIGSLYHRVLYFWHYLGNRFITFCSNMFTNLNFTDIETCYKAFKREVIQDIEIEQDRFGFEVEITSKIAKKKCRVYEVGISYSGRTYEEGKKIGWKDGVQALYLILKYR